MLRQRLAPIVGSRNSDVTLVIKARDEAQKTIDAIGSALQRLLGDQEKVSGSAAKTGGNISDLASTAAKLDKAYTTLAGSATNAEAAFTRQKAGIAGQKEELKNLQAQAASAAAVLAKLNSGDSIVAAGRDQSGRLAQVKQVGAEYERLVAQQVKLAAAIATQENALGNSVSSLQRIGSTTNAVEAAVAKAREELDRQTRSLERNTAAAGQNAAVKPRIDAVTGVNRPAATENGATFSALEKVVNAEIAAEQAERARAAAIAVTNTKLAEQAQLEAALERHTGLGRTPATANGATFSALEAQAKSTEAGAAAEREMASAAARLRAQLDPLADVEARLVVEQGKLNDLFRAGKISSTELSQGVALLRANADKAIVAINGQNGKGANGKPSLFGLKPYELTNLGYQINDVVTQLASGTSLTQTLAQQGGQILQLFPRVGAAIVAGLTSAPVLAFTAALAVLVIGLKEAGDDAENLRKLNAILALNADGARYQASAVMDSSKALERFGMSAADALTIVRLATKEGIDPSRINAFGMAAKDMADVMGIKVVDAAKQLADAFTGGFTAIEKLDRETNIYTASQLAMIRALFEQGRAHEAVAAASGIAFEKLDKSATAARGPWAEAMLRLNNAWHGFLDTLGDSEVIQSTLHALEALAGGVTNVLKRLSDPKGVQDIDAKITQLERLYSRALTVTTGAKGKIKYSVADEYKGVGTSPLYQQAADELNKLMALRDKALSKAAKPAEDLRLQTTEATAKANARVAEEIERAAAAAMRVTKESDITAKLAQVRVKALKEIQDREPNASPKMQAAFADNAVNDERIKLEKQLLDYKKQQANEIERANRANGTMQAQTIALLKQTEGFKSKAYWDRNAYRVGYGSDRTTAADGTVARVTAKTTVDEPGAMRDLERRVKEFSDTVKRQVGADRYNAFSPQQQAALNSIAYNYGSLPERILGAVRTGSAKEIANSIRALGGDNGGVNRGRRNKEAALIEMPNIELEQSTADIEKERLDTQAQFNEKINDENDKRRLGIASMQVQNGLLGEALIAEQKKQAIAEAVLQKQQEIDKLNARRAKEKLAPVEFTGAQRTEIEQTTAAYFDLAHAKDVAAARRQVVDDQVSQLTAQRDAIRQQIDLAQQQGQSATGLQNTLAGVKSQLEQATEAQLKFYEAIIAGGPAVWAVNRQTAESLQAIIDKIKLVQAENKNTGTQFLATGRQINESIANGAANAFDRFAQSVAEGKNVFKSLKDAFLQFAADFLRQIAMMIIKQIAFNAISGGGGGSGGAGGGIAGVLGGIFGAKKHTGGIVGAVGETTTRINPAWYANPLRYHTGGIAGLAPDEVPAVLRKGEEVLTAADPRHRANGGGATGAKLKVVTLFDKEAAIQEMLNTTAGEEAILNVIQNNPSAFKAAMG